MYKTKITEWGLRKYRKAEGSRAASVAARQSSKSPSGVELGDHKNRSLDLWMDSVSTSNPCQLIVGLPKHVLSPKSVDDRVELVLRCIAGYSDRWLEDRVSIPWEFSPSSSSWIKQMTKSVALLSLADSDSAWETLDLACGIAGQVMSQPYNDLLRNVLVIFLRQWWLAFPRVRAELLRYLTKLAAMKLGCKHPFTIVLFHFIDEDVLLRSAESALQIAITAAESERMLLRRSAWTLNHSYCCLLLDRKEHKAAAAQIDQLLASTTLY
jgi:hypothetical protein